MATMSQEEIAELLAEPRLTHLATVRPDGRPHVTPIWFIEDNGKAYIMAGANAVKFRNVRRNPKVSLSIGTEERPYKYVVLEGEGRLRDDNPNNVIERICVRYDGPERGGAFARELIASGTTLVLEVDIQKVLSWNSD